MPTGKRASMREGPLADLFRKTTEDTGPAPEAKPQPEPPAPDVKLVRQQRQRQSRSKRSGKR